MPRAVLVGIVETRQCSLENPNDAFPASLGVTTRDVVPIGMGWG